MNKNKLTLLSLIKPSTNTQFRKKKINLNENLKANKFYKVKD